MYDHNRPHTFHGIVNTERKTKYMLKQDILKHEYNTKIDEERKKMVLQSYFKYGPAEENFKKRGEQGSLVNALDTMSQCVCKYDKTHNMEYLLDAMNYLMFEFMYPSYDDAYFKHTDSDGSAGIVGTSYNEIKEYQNGSSD